MNKNQFEEILQSLQLKQFEYMVREAKAKAEAAESIAERECLATDAVRREIANKGFNRFPA